MLKPRELAAYLERLPKNAFLVHKGTKYGVNRELLVHLCGFAADKLKDGGNEVEIDLADELNLIPEICAFLNGKQIEVNSSNDVELLQLARELKIAPLQRLAEESVAAPLSMSNVFGRIGRCEGEALSQFDGFLKEHVHELVSDGRVFSLPIQLLKVIFESEAFAQWNGKWQFIFECWKRFPEHASELYGTEEHLLEMPDDVLRKLVSSEAYAGIDGVVPMWVIAKKLQDELSRQIQTSKDLSGTLADIKQQIAEIQEEQERAREEAKQHSRELSEEQKNIESFWVHMNTMGCHCMMLASDLYTFHIDNTIKDNICDLLNKLTEKCDELQRLVAYVRSKKVPVIFHELETKGGKLVDGLAQALKELRPVVDRLETNGLDLDDLINEIRSYAIEVQKMSLIALRQNA